MNFPLKIKSLINFNVYNSLVFLVNEDISWKPHCEHVLKECSEALGLLFRVSRYLPLRCVKIFLKALILLRLNYCYTVWGSAQNQESVNNLQKLQYETARLILGYKFDEILGKSSIDNEIGWLTVRQRPIFWLIKYNLQES